MFLLCLLCAALLLTEVALALRAAGRHQAAELRRQSLEHLRGR